MNANQFEELDAQSEMYAYARMTPEEHAEAQHWFDKIQQQAIEEMAQLED
jgi:hypothetical protein